MQMKMKTFPKNIILAYSVYYILSLFFFRHQLSLSFMRENSINKKENMWKNKIDVSSNEKRESSTFLFSIFLAANLSFIFYEVLYPFFLLRYFIPW